MSDNKSCKMHLRTKHAHRCVCFMCVNAVVLLVAQLQDCVEAVCNKCAQLSGPKEIYHKWEGRKSAQGKEKDGTNGGERGTEWEKT